MLENTSPKADPQGGTASRLAMLAELATAVANATEYHNTLSPQRLTHSTTPRSLPKGPEPLRAAGLTPLPLPLPPAPSTPYPWTWRCHGCDSEYPLAVTRRCLYCSHRFCTAPQTNARIKRGVPGERDSCDAEFDYYGWAAWGAYRRSVAASRILRNGVITAVDSSCEQTKGSLKRKRGCDIGATDHDTFAKFELTTDDYRQYESDTRRSVWRPLSRLAQQGAHRRKEKMYVSGQYSCWLHCDYPTECVRSLYRAWAEGRARSSGGDHSFDGRSDEKQESSRRQRGKASRAEEGGSNKKRKKDVAHPEPSHGTRRGSMLRESMEGDR
ncbi:uncharacterized protein B0H64DRAFT_137608 [Chaetomium fimeti]|uniref:Uncharacterized protein n=1 Tax=Chaetomium fimeti TaxID=1854472 RepID=A0AAE0HK75_9PEZI|nr:hypothetical protein B0H64DRAFT_137608 [Chaetomium fimeti]